MARTVRFTTLARSVVSVIRDQQLSFLAAAVAYYAFVSLVPLVLLALAVATGVGGRVLTTQVVGLLGEFLTPEAIDLVEVALTGTAGRGEATVLGLLVLVWSSLRLFRGLDIAFSRVYGSAGTGSFFGGVLNALVVLAAIAVGIGATALAGAAFPLSRTPFLPLVAPLFLVVCLTVVFLPLYYVFPDRTVTVREALPGTVAAAVGWTLLGTVFGVYADRAAAFQLYGVIGGVLLVLAWFYLGGFVVLVGAALNAALADGGDRQLQQGGPRGATRPMSPDDDEDVATVEPEPGNGDVAELRRELERFEEDVEDRTVHRDELEADLRRYVRKRARRGHARGWGPYLVLLYGTVMTLGAFYFLNGVWAILAMVVVWLSTLGLYALMVLVGMAVSAVGLSGRVLDVVRKLRP